MVTKIHKVDPSLGLPEKKKKKKKKKKVPVMKEPETQYSVLNSNNYFSDAPPVRVLSPGHEGKERVSETSPGKKKKKKGRGTAGDEGLQATRAKSRSPRRQVLHQLECRSGEKKKKRKSLPSATLYSSQGKMSPDSKPGEELSKTGKKVKKHKKEKKASGASPLAIATCASWLREAGDAQYIYSLESEAEEQAALGQKRKQGSPREHSVKKRKKKTFQEGDALLSHSKSSRSEEDSPSKGSKKQPGKGESPEYILLGDSPRTPGKKKEKSRKKVEQPAGEELAAKRKKKKKKKKETGVDSPWQEEEESDTDLEVVLEKKGNMDEACIDQVRRKALQEEIDRESGKTEASEPKNWTETQFGQWDTAGFENEEQKLKFLKLMGGFKHLSPSFSRPPNVTAKPNMALDKQAADSLQQSLQLDYDRALSWKYSRGAGLGFTDAADKVFYIDRNASKSIKLPD